MSVKSLIIPLGVFLGLVGILAIGFTLEDPHYLPSELINRPFPEFSAAELHDESRQVTTEDLQGQVSLVNVWATWCANCIIEHPELMRIKNEEDIPIYGINYNDDVAKARRWLERYDNPYELNIVDDEGKLGIDLGVYGAPETFIIDENAVIQYRHVGVLTEEIFDDTFRPIIDQLERDDSEGTVMRTIVVLMTLLSLSAHAAIDAYEFPDEALETRYTNLIEKLRCPQCLNTNLAGSDAMIAKDLRREVHRMLLEGKSDEEILAFMHERYGDFILYEPRVTPATLVLWYGPFVLLGVGALIAGAVIWRRRRNSSARLTGDEQARLNQLLSK